MRTAIHQHTPIDTLFVSKDLQKSKFTKNQSDTLSTMFKDLEDKVVKKDDIRILEVMIESLNDNIDGKLHALENKIDGKINSLEEKIDGRINSLEEKIDGRINSLEEKIDGRINSLEERMDKKINSSMLKCIISIGGMIAVSTMILSLIIK